MVSIQVGDEDRTAQISDWARAKEPAEAGTRSEAENQDQNERQGGVHDPKLTGTERERQSYQATLRSLSSFFSAISTSLAAVVAKRRLATWPWKSKVWAKA